MPINSLSTYSALFSARERKASKGKHGKRGKRECVAKTGNVKTKHKIRLLVAQIENVCGKVGRRKKSVAEVDGTIIADGMQNG